MNISVEQANSDTGQTELVKQYSGWHFSAAFSDFIAAIFFNVFFKNILSAMPILLGLVVGYLYSFAIMVLLDFTPVKEASWFAVPNFLIPGVDYEFIDYRNNFISHGSSRDRNDFRTYRSPISIRKSC